MNGKPVVQKRAGIFPLLVLVNSPAFADAPHEAEACLLSDGSTDAKAKCEYHVFAAVEAMEREAYTLMLKAPAFANELHEITNMENSWRTYVDQDCKMEADITEG